MSLWLGRHKATPELVEPQYTTIVNINPQPLSAFPTRSRPARNHEYDNDLEAPRLQLQKYNWHMGNKNPQASLTTRKIEVSIRRDGQTIWDAGA